MSMRINRTITVFVILGGLIFLFLTLPIINIFIEQFAFHFPVLISSVKDPTVLNAVGLSLFAAFLSVLITFVLGVPLAYLLVRRDFKGKNIVEGLTDLPMAIPHVVAGIALLTVLGSGGVIGELTESFLMFEGALPGIVGAMLFVSAPYMIGSAREGFQSVDPHLENVARNLGASEWQAFIKVTFPLAFPSILSGAIMAWSRAISAFSAVVILVSFHPMITTGLIWHRLWTVGLAEAMAVAVILLLFVLLAFIALRYLRGRLLDKYS